MAIEKFTKQPADNLDYDIDFGSEWMVAGDQIQSVAPVTADAGITVGVTDFNASTNVVKQWLSGGTAGAIYKVTVKITTAQGRVKESEFRIRVKEI